MAAIFRMGCVQGLRKGLALTTPKEIVCRRIIITPRNFDNVKETQSLVKKKWASYGFSSVNEAKDRHSMHQTLFVTISLCLVGGSAIMAYLPDVKGKDWAQREAYLRLRYREEQGLPLIDPNVIDPARITLPSDEELKDVEIII